MNSDSQGPAGGRATLVRGRRGLPPRALYLLLTGASGLVNSITFVTYGLYVVRGAGLDPLQLVLAGTALELSVFLSEVPTGALADAYSRRLSVIVGYVISGAGFVVMGLSPTFLFIAGGQALWGFGWTFISGAREAWLADEIGEEAAAPMYIRSTQITQMARMAGIPLAVALAFWSLQAPLIFGGALSVLLALALTVTMTEHGYTPAAAGDRSTWGAMGSTLRAGIGAVRGSSVLVAILLIQLCYGASSEAFDRLNSLLLIETIGLPGRFDDVVWFGVIGVVSLLGSVVATGLVGRATGGGATAVVRSLTVLTAILTAASLVFALTGNIWVALGALWLTAWVRVAINPLLLIWVNRGLDPRSRATVLSMVGQADALGQVGGGPVLGLLGTLRTVRTALVGVGVLLLPALGLYGRELARGEDDRDDGDGGATNEDGE